MPDQAPQTTQELKNLLDGIVALADKEAKGSDSYKELFADDGGLDGLLRQADHQMTKVALNTLRVLREKFGEETGDDTLFLLLALPYLRVKLRKHIEETQGSSCCVDKTFYHLVEKLKETL